jgi:hypothetical protein
VSHPYTIHSGHLRLTVRLTPKSGSDRIDGTELDADGEAQLKVRVSAVPEDGKANKALVALLARTLRLPKSAITILSGETSRKKILRIDGDPEDLAKKLGQF